MNVSVYIEDQELDLFQDETIEIKSSVQDINDIKKNTLDFSKNFTVPASEINNKIFKHYYNQNITNGFDARTKVSGRIDIDGIPYKYGRFSLLSVKMKGGKPSSYSIVFYGNLISIVDLVGNDELSDLDLSTYNHSYNSSNVKLGIESSLFGGVIKYTPIVKKTYYYSTKPNDSTQTETLTNIARVGTPGVNGIVWNDLRPSIKLIAIIEAIETKYGFTFTKDFFGRSEFDNIYLWLNNDSEKSLNETVDVNYENKGTLEDNTFVNTTVDLVNNTIRFDDPGYDAKARLQMIITPSVGFKSIPYTIIRYDNGQEAASETRTGDFTYELRGEQYNVEYSYKIKVNRLFKFTSRLRYFKLSGLWDLDASFPEQSITLNFNLSQQLPKLKIIDFLKGLFSMFKLILYQEKETDPIYVNTLNEYYKEGKLFDVNKYIDTSSHEVKRPELLNEINFNFEEPQSLLAKQFENNTSVAFGDLELKLEENGEPLDGKKEEIKLPFEQVVYSRLNDLNDDVQVDFQYAAIIGEDSEPTNIKPLIHYVNNVRRQNSRTIGFIDDVGTWDFLEYINLPSHTLNFENVNHTLFFNREQNTYTGNFEDNTLYKNYHEDFITSIFHNRKRLFNHKAILPIRVVLNLRLNDLLKIKEDFYRINSYTYNLITGKAKLELTNSFDEFILSFQLNKTVINTDFNAKTESVFASNFENIIFDNNSGWVTNVYRTGGNVFFDISENLTGFGRTTIIKLQDTGTLTEINVTINQTANIITVDNDLITVDNNLITVDNG